MEREHPTPIFKREEWRSLNGKWSFAIRSWNWKRPQEKDQEPPDDWDGDIRVPFCLQAPLSGALDALGASRCKRLKLTKPPLAGKLDQDKLLWYFRELPKLPESWHDDDARVFLHIGSCDTVANVKLNDEWLGGHVGGSTRFSFDITEALRDPAEGQNKLWIRVADRLPGDKGLYPCGKQIHKNQYRGPGPHIGTLYSNVTGLWQDVWLEKVNAHAHLVGVKVAPRLDEASGRWSLELRAELPKGCKRAGLTFTATLTSAYAARRCRALLSVTTQLSESSTVHMDVPAASVRPWSPESPHLYGLQLQLCSGGEVLDMVHSYSALRVVRCQDGQVLLNGKPRFLRLVLDQGWYPDGLWTAPSTKALRKDIVLAKKAGFEGARCHQKVFQPAYFTAADRLGFIVFAEYPDWPGGQSGRWDMRDDHTYMTLMAREWQETVENLHNHPSIIVWGMFNEMGPKNGWDFQTGPGGGFRNWRTPKDRKKVRDTHEKLAVDVAKAIRSVDVQKRPIHDVSGWIHVPKCRPDIWSVHEYQQKPEKLLQILSEPHEKYVHGRSAQPLLVAEYGGVGWDDGGPLTSAGSGLSGGVVGAGGKNPEKFLAGYNGAPGLPKSSQEALQRIKSLTRAICQVPHVAGFCYTQLYDVEFEKNGLLKYDRKLKKGFSWPKLRSIFGSGGVRRTVRKRSRLTTSLARRTLKK